MKKVPQTSFRKLKKRVLIFRAIIPAFLLLAAWQYSGNIIYARKLECYTQFGNCPSFVNEQIQWLINYPLLKPLPVKQVRDQLKSYPEIKAVSLYRRLPSTLVLSVMLSKPIGLVGQQVLGSHSIADTDGRIVGETSESVLPLLLADPISTDTGRISEVQLESLKLLDQISSVIPGQLIGKVNDREVSVSTQEGTEILFNLSYLPDNWAATLKLIIQRSKILSKIPKVIDFRFSSPTITF